LSRINPGDLVRVRRPTGGPIMEEHIGLYIKTDETLIGRPEDPGSSILITKVVMVGGKLMRFNSPYWQFDIVSTSET
jgi:hypothetical protein